LPPRVKSGSIPGFAALPIGKAAGVPGGYDPLVAGRFEASEKGRQRKRWKGGTRSGSPSKASPLPSVEEPCPLSLSHGFITTQPPPGIESCRVFEITSLIHNLIFYQGKMIVAFNSRLIIKVCFRAFWEGSYPACSPASAGQQ
jgi:hypothetical protein